MIMPTGLRGRKTQEIPMERRHVMFGMAAVSLLPLAGQAFAQGKVIEKDKLKALMGGDFATATSELAATKAKNRMVMTFAELEIAEQAAVAKAFGARPGAAGLSEKHAAMVQKLQAAEGAQFDMMYINGQIDGHEELLAIHKTYARSGSDPMARGASIVGVTSIQSHLVMLKGIKSMLS
jgi:putative membrane protein